MSFLIGIASNLHITGALALRAAPYFLPKPRIDSQALWNKRIGLDEIADSSRISIAGQNHVCSHALCLYLRLTRCRPGQPYRIALDQVLITLSRSSREDTSSATLIILLSRSAESSHCIWPFGLGLRGNGGGGLFFLPRKL